VAGGGKRVRKAAEARMREIDAIIVQRGQR
jgi:hypothetical protein